MLKRLIHTAVGAVLLAAAPVVAQAAPVLYDVAFDAIDGPSGIGSFHYDSGTGSMTGFTWDFGDDRTGGVLDSYLASDMSADKSRGQFLFETISGTHPDGVLGFSMRIFQSDRTGTFPDGGVSIFCWGGLNDSCNMPASQTSTYLFDGTDFSDEESRGYITVSRTVPVPEPATLALLVAGLAGLGLTRRARA